MARQKRFSEEDWRRNLTLFELPEPGSNTEVKTVHLRNPVWSEHKARLIERYLYYFVLVTYHGTYIDGFAGPQYPDRLDRWSAKRVIESQPMRLRRFFLFEQNAEKVIQLEQLKADQPLRDQSGRKLSRKIVVQRGDSNVLIPELLGSGNLPKEATFCLLDQRTFECHWSTVRALAQYKGGKTKIEIFYFLAFGWFRRAVSELENDDILRLWWEREDWQGVRQMSESEVLTQVVARFREELGYRSVKAYPIFDRETHGRVLYNLIHATDHPEAPTLMTRAYNRVLKRKEPQEQFKLWLESKD